MQKSRSYDNQKPRNSISRYKPKRTEYISPLKVLCKRFYNIGTLFFMQLNEKLSEVSSTVGWLYNVFRVTSYSGEDEQLQATIE